jgi:hypothetical protein
MLSNFQKPSSLALSILSILWVIIAAWLSVRLALVGNILGALIMLVFGIAAVGLWFQSRVAAWTLIVLACAGTIFGLFSIGHTPGLRIAGRVCFAIWSITLLFDYLKNDSSS